MIEWKETNGDFTAEVPTTLSQNLTQLKSHSDSRKDSATWVRMGYEPRFRIDVRTPKSIRESEKIC